MKIEEIIEILENKVSNLKSTLTQLRTSGDLEGIVSTENQMRETENTIKILNSTITSNQIRLA